jgi:sugar phosphate isomerase/epimerase
MKLAICSEVFRTPIDATIRQAAEIGFDGIEIAPFNVAADVTEVAAARRQELARLCGTCGIEVVGLHWLLVSPEGLHLASPDAAVRERTWRYLADLVRFCADLGGKLLVLGSPRQRSIAAGVDPAEAWKWAADGLREAAKVAAACRVKILIEPLTPKETNFINTVD